MNTYIVLYLTTVNESCVMKYKIYECIHIFIFLLHLYYYIL